MKRNSIVIVVALSIISVSAVSGIMYYYTHNGMIGNAQGNDIYYGTELPEKPADFDLILREMQTHYIDLCQLDERYFLQPAFYSNSWIRGKRYYDNHDYERWGVYGYGAYPGNLVIEFQNATVGNWISLCTFFHTGWNVETWQGIKLIAEENEYFSVNIEPNEFLLGRTFPVFKCSKEDSWAKKLNLNISILKAPPAGTYEIGINTANPSTGNSKKWFWYIMRQNMTSAIDLQMIEECEQELEMSTKCEEWISSSRKNKYIDSSIFQMPPRLTLKIIVK